MIEWSAQLYCLSVLRFATSSLDGAVSSQLPDTRPPTSTLYGKRSVSELGKMEMDIHFHKYNVVHK